MWGRQTQKSTKTLWPRMFMFQEAITCLWIYPGKPMTIIKSLFFVRAHGAIEPCLFAASYLTIFTTSVSSADPTFQRHVFLHNMESSTIFSRKEIWRIRRGGQSTNIISEATEMADGSIYGVYRAILCRGGSITNGDWR